ncbi:MAG: sulfur transferase domain-containing protein [Rubrobacter sp.]|nr:sulfur transferase domain-containing protein [Rubrobacter sp.]
MDLRTGEEDRGLSGGVTEMQAVRSAGMEYVSLPLASEAGAYTAGAFDRFREIMSEASRRPLLVHCRTATRVEPLILAYLALDEGKSIEEAVSLADEIGARKQELHERALSYIESRQSDWRHAPGK